MQHVQARSRSLAFQQMFAVQRNCASSKFSLISHAFKKQSPFTAPQNVFPVQTTCLREQLMPDSCGFSSCLYPRVGRRFGPIHVRADRSVRSHSGSDASGDSDSESRAALSALSRRKIQELAKKHSLRLECMRSTVSSLNISRFVYGYTLP